MKHNADITVVRIDQEGTVHQQVIREVIWHDDRKVTVTDKGLLSADFVSIFIKSKSLLPETVIKRGDRIVKGIKDYKDLKGKDLKRHLEADGAVSVISIQDNLSIGPKLGHLELGCE